LLLVRYFGWGGVGPIQPVLNPPPDSSNASKQLFDPHGECGWTPPTIRTLLPGRGASQPVPILDVDPSHLPLDLLAVGEFDP
jgi:hypothetical protein